MGAEVDGWPSYRTLDSEDDPDGVQEDIDFVELSPSVHGKLAQFDAEFGDRMAGDEEIDGGDAVDWIAEFAPGAREVLEAAT